MKKIIIKTVHLISFKGLKGVSFNFNPHGNLITGGNGVGKTTIYNAVLWGLYGKDTNENENFEVLPRDSDATQGDSASVRVVFTLNDELHSITRQYEKTYKRNGALKGHVNTIIWNNDPPYNLRDFNRAFTDVLPEDLFTILTRIDGFISLPQITQRDVLISLISPKTDREYIQACTTDKEVLTIFNKYNSLSSAKTALLEKIDITNKELLQIKENIKILSEQPIPEYTAEIINSERETLKRQKAEVETKIRKLEEQLNTYTPQFTERTLKADALAKVDAGLRSCQEALDQENIKLQAKYDEEVKKVEEERDSIQREINSAKTKQYEGVSIRNQIAEKEMEMVNISKSILRAQGKEYKTELICPVGEHNCLKLIGDTKKAFEASKADVVKKLKLQKETLEVEIKELNVTLKGLHTEAVQGALTKYKDKLDSLVFPEHVRRTLETQPGYAELEKERQRLIAHIKSATDSAKAEKAKVEDLNSGILKEIRELRNIDFTTQEEEITIKTLKLETSSQNQGRITTMLVEVEKLNALLTTLTGYHTKMKHIFACKIKMVEDEVNSLFPTVKFLLSMETLDGEFKDRCEATINGVLFRSLNRAAQVRAGLEIKTACEKFYKLSLPIFLDNMEGVFGEIPLTGQYTIIKATEKGELSMKDI